MLESDKIKVELAALRAKAEDLVKKEGVTAEELDDITNQIDVTNKKLKAQLDIENAQREALEGEVIPPMATAKETKEPKNVLLEEAMDFQNFMMGKQHTLKTVSNSLGTGSPDSGGVAVGSTLSSEIIRTIKDRADAYSFFDGRVGSGNWEIIVISDETSAEWVAEGDSPAGTTDPATSKTVLTQKRLYKEIELTQQLVNSSSQDFVDAIIDVVADAIIDTLEAAIFNGSGVKDPTGISTGLDSKRKVTASTLGEVTLEELKQVKYRVKRRYRKNSAWFMNDETMLAIDLLKDSNGRPLLQPNPSMETDYVLLGSPVMITDGLNGLDVAEKASIVFANNKAYETNTQKVVSFNVYNDSAYKKRGMIGLASDIYVDGKVKDANKLAVLVNPVAQ